MLVMERSRYVPKDYTLFRKLETLGIEVFVGESNGKFYAIGYKGKSIKPNFHHWFRSIEFRNTFITKFVDDTQKSVDSKAALRAERYQARNLVVGDILYSTWGYEQTNVDYYQVTALVGKSSVEVREIGQLREASGHDTGYSVPVPDQFIGEPIIKRVTRGDVIKMASYSYTRKKDFQLVAGAKVFKPDFWSSYA